MTTVLVWYMVAIAILDDGSAHVAKLGEHSSIAECFEQRELKMGQAGIGASTKRLELGIQVVCVGKEKEAI